MEHKLNYIIQHFKSIYNIDHRLNIGYGSETKTKVNICKDENDFFDSNSPIPAKIVWRKWKEIKIPFLFAEEEREIMEHRDGQVFINYDIIASAFYFLSGWQEYNSPDRDQFGRFPYRKSLQYTLNIMELPIVNYYFDILKTAIEKAYHTKLSVQPWGGSKFGVFLSHDIDRCETGWKEVSWSRIIKGRLLAPFGLLLKRLLDKDVWFNFEEVIEADATVGAKSTYFFMTEKGLVNGHPNADYDVTNSKFSKVFELVRDQGSEVALHGSFGSHSSVNQLIREKQKLKARVKGNRFHYLIYDNRLSPSVVEECELTYDSSLCFAEHIGFRNSYCFPFVPYDFTNDRRYHFLEIPINVMDVTMDSINYMNLSPEQAIVRVSNLIDEVVKFNGMFSLLWHNHYLSSYKNMAWKKAYLQILKYCQANCAGFYTGKELSELFCHTLK